MPTPPSQPPGARRGEPTPKRRAQPPGPPPKPDTQRPAPPKPGAQRPAPPKPDTQRPAPPKPGTQRPAPPKPGTQRPALPKSGPQHPAPLPEPGTRKTEPGTRKTEPGTRKTEPGTRKTTRPTCPREAGRPLPDPAAVRLCAVPDSAPPYDDEALARALSAETAHVASSDADRPTSHGGQANDSRQASDGRQANDGRQASDGGSASDGGRGRRRPRPDSEGTDPASPDPADPGEGDRDREVTPGWPSLFAQVLAETLAGSRPPGQIVPWTTQRARSNIQRLGPTLTAGQPTAGPRPLVRRVVTSRPSSDVLEMTVIVRFGPRIRALAVRLERAIPHRALPGDAVRAARWLCTAVEAA
jgi:hypothetical protein